MKRSRAEQNYDALASEWKTVRLRLIDEVKELKQSHAEQLKELAEEYKKVLTFKDVSKKNGLATHPAPKAKTENRTSWARRNW